MENRENFVIVDANSIIHRAFHALPPLKSKDNQVVNAVYGFFFFFFKLTLTKKFYIARSPYFKVLFGVFSDFFFFFFG